MDNRAEVREFLTLRRAKITPDQAGLPEVGQRRDRCRRRTDCTAEGSGRAPPLAAAYRANLPPGGFDHLRGDDGSCNADGKRLVNEGVSASLPRTKRELPGAIPKVS
jgi:hypothetical protein